MNSEEDKKMYMIQRTSICYREGSVCDCHKQVEEPYRRHAAWPSGKDSLVPFMATVYGSVTPSSKEVHKGRDQDRKDGPQEDWSGT